jgi:hypothetical protein
VANTAGVSNSFKYEVMLGLHQLGAVTLVSRSSLTAPTTDSLKAALYLASATTNATNAVYTVTGEATTGSGYTAGGIAVTNATAPSLSSTTGVWTPSASLVYTTVTTGSVDAVMIYNSTQGNRAIEICTFTAQSPVAATLTLTMPVNSAGTALLNIA